MSRQEEINSLRQKLDEQDKLLGPSEERNRLRKKLDLAEKQYHQSERLKGTADNLDAIGKGAKSLGCLIQIVITVFILVVLVIVSLSSH